MLDELLKTSMRIVKINPLNYNALSTVVQPHGDAQYCRQG